MVWTERNIMAKLSDSACASPFLVTLEHAFQSERELFFVMEFMYAHTHRSLIRIISISTFPHTSALVLCLSSLGKAAICVIT